MNDDVKKEVSTTDVSAALATPSNVPPQESLTETEVAAAIRQLVYRKTYNQRPDVKEARRKYMQRRQQVVKLALEAYRKQQGGGE